MYRHKTNKLISLEQTLRDVEAIYTDIAGFDLCVDEVEGLRIEAGKDNDFRYASTDTSVKERRKVEIKRKHLLKAYQIRTHCDMVYRIIFSGEKRDRSSKKIRRTNNLRVTSSRTTEIRLIRCSLWSWWTSRTKNNRRTDTNEDLPKDTLSTPKEFESLNLTNERFLNPSLQLAMIKKFLRDKKISSKTFWSFTGVPFKLEN